MGRNVQEKLDMRIRCVDAWSNHVLPNASFFSLKSFCDNLMLVDDTLSLNYFPDRQRYPDFPQRPVIGKDLLDFMIKNGDFPSVLRPDIIKVLRLLQKIKVRDKKAMSDTDKFSCFSYREKWTEHHIIYSEDTGMFKCRQSESQYPILVRKYIDVKPDNVASPPKEFLFQLVKGDQEQLCALAKLAACCLSAGKLFNGVIVLSAEQGFMVCDFLSMVAGKNPESFYTIKGIRELSKQSVMDELIEMKMRGQPFAFCKDNASRLNPEQWERLRKLFSGVRLTCNDPVLGRKMHRSTTQWFIIGNDQTMSKLKIHKIRAKRLSLDFEEISSVSEVLWMQRIFPLWGYLQLKGKKEEAKGSEFKTVHLFMDNCCQITKNEVEFIPAKSLYDHYVAYCNDHGWTDILKLKDFNDVLKLKRIRHHFTDGKNPTGFKNILLVNDVQCKAKGEQEVLPPKELFYQKLDQMEEEVRAHFDQYPF